MMNYVLIYAVFPVGDFLLVRKAQPEWQRGRLNLPGGKVEPDEDVMDAAWRELREETGIDSAKCWWSYGGGIFGEEWNVDVWRAEVPVSEFGNLRPEFPRDHPRHEPLTVSSLDDAVREPTLIPNLRAVLPLMAAHVPFQLRDDFEDSDPQRATHRMELTLTHLPSVVRPLPQIDVGTRREICEIFSKPPGERSWEKP